MKADIKLEWHMHVDNCLIRIDRDFWDHNIYVVEDEYCSKGFKTLGEAITFAKNPDRWEL